ncbi:polysialyltransferase family glycosyltransferase [Sulfurimonas sp.]|uniref:polysialyltransferase family glycosyltransferase n=1 Tax=Sulfurimonas sp. TaxID=2022749 RepID=UPI0019D87E93|nr:polysialyltransferase family glycosyltransferase [Sulfurimonas sp.]MBE0514846.1 hypothetical protein [Sulfurimonas sp.]
MKNLFIIGTPLQLINAIEAINNFKLENNILIIVHRSLEANRTQLDKIRNLYEWEEIIDIEYSKHSSLLKYIDLVKHLKMYAYKYIFFPKLEVIPKIVIANVKKEKVFLLDDGTMTIMIYENNIKTNKLNEYNFKEIRFLFFGLKIKIRDKINLFTYFDLPSVNGIEVIKNNLLYLKDDVKNGKKDDDTIFFLGQPLTNIIDDATYRNSLESIIKKHNKKLIYIPHRGETKEKIDYLSKLDNPYFSVKDIGMPAELFFLNNNIYPTHVMSYYSTALTTLDMIYDDCIINYIKVPENSKSKAAFDRNLRKYYEVFGSDKILTLQDLGM